MGEPLAFDIGTLILGKGLDLDAVEELTLKMSSGA